MWAMQLLKGLVLLGLALVLGACSQAGGIEPAAAPLEQQPAVGAIAPAGTPQLVKFTADW
jgi:hypothetical protein